MQFRAKKYKINILGPSPTRTLSDSQATRLVTMFVPYINQ